MSNESISTIFPELNHPAWVKEREECWALALVEGKWKSEYRKKDLAIIREYFFTGTYPEGVDVSNQIGAMLELFPIQTAKGYDYFYQNNTLTAKEVEGNFTSAFVTQQSSGMRWKEQKEYYDYHVGHQFQQTKVTVVQGKEIKFHVDSAVRFMDMTAKFSKFLRRGTVTYVEKLVYFLPYYIDCYKHVVSEGLADKLNEEVVLVRLKKRLESGDCYVSKEEPESSELLAEELKKFLKSI